LIVTNRYFTEQAQRLAKANGVILWNRDGLARARLAISDRSTSPVHSVPTAR
jgi:hypothetical protein